MKGQTNVDTTQTTSCLEWCAGYGGISLGLKRAIPSLRTIAFGEIEAFACANLVAKMEAGLLDPAPIWTDIKTFPCEEFRDKVDILVAGYPCQPFSSAGKRLGTEDPRHLWPHIQRSISIIRPRLCFFENVEGHISLGLSTVISDLEELGYKVSWGIFSASEVGAPHQRKRVFILAYRIGDGHNWRELQDRVEGWQGCQLPQPLGGESCGVWSEVGRCGQVWPSRPGEARRDEELGNATDLRPCGLGANAGAIGEDQSRKECGMHESARASALPRHDAQPWPSRPGEPQHGWEPPRVVANSERGRGEEPEHQHANLPSEPSGGNTEAMGNTLLTGSSSEWSSRGQQDGFGEPSAEAMGNADHGRLASGINAGSCTEADRRGEGDIEQAESGQIESNVGLHSHGNSNGLGHAELSGLCDSELAEIREWMVKCDNRTDELRLLGNGVVPATAARAFVTLLQELTK